MKLKRFNDWGSVYYAEEDKGLVDGIASVANGVKLAAGQWFRVTWPDGSQETMQLAGKPYESRVPDMGHTYEVRGTLYGFTVAYHGVALWVQIEDVDVEFADGATS